MSDSTPAKQPEIVECPDCEGDGEEIDPTACGDPEHCNPFVKCRTCSGEGVVLVETLRKKEKAMILVHPDGKRQYSPVVQLIWDAGEVKVEPVVPFVWLKDA